MSKPQQSLDPNFDPQLCMNGWVRVSREILPAHEAVEKIKGAIETKPSSQEFVSKVISTYKVSKSYSSYLWKRFMGDKSAQLLLEDEVPVEEPTNYTDLYAVLLHRDLHFYRDETRQELVFHVVVPCYSVTLYPSNISDHELYLTYNPIVLAFDDECECDNHDVKLLYIYPFSASDKENWFIILRRATRLPLYADDASAATFFKESDHVKQYVEAMEKLIKTTESKEGEEQSATAWLNALVGRMFVAIHANKNVKDWVIQRISRHAVESENDSLLGDIVIEDIDVGDSLPVLSNPKLVQISIDGDMLIEMDIDYTGGLRFVASTTATVSISALERVLKPMVVPIAIGMTLKRFAARVLIKIKPFWESNRVWFGFYRKPELVLELEVDPIISNKLIKLSMVNEVIQKRIKDALEQHLMLPKMDDLSFWNFDGLNPSPFVPLKEGYHTELFNDEPKIVVDEEDYESVVREGSIINASESVVTFNRRPSITSYISKVEKHMEGFQDPQSSYANENIIKEESPLNGQSEQEAFNLKLGTLSAEPESIENIVPEEKRIESAELRATEPEEGILGLDLGNVTENESSANTQSQDTIKKPGNDSAGLFGVSDDTSSHLSDSQSVVSDNASSIAEFIGNAAYNLGIISRQIAADHRTQTLVSSVATMAQPAVSYAQQKTTVYKQIVQDQAAAVGLSAIEKLGLKPDEEDLHKPGNERLATGISRRQRRSNSWSLMGLNISTSRSRSSYSREPSMTTTASEKSQGDDDELDSSIIDQGQLYMSNSKVCIRSAGN